MNLQHVKNENVRQMGSFVSLGNAGLVSFSKEAKTALNLKEGSKLLVLQDKEKPRDWYVTLSENGDNVIRIFKEDFLGFNSSSICQKIKKSLDLDPKKTLRIALGVPFEHEGQTLVALLTAKV